MTREEKERLIESDILSIENRVRHAFNQGYDLGYKDGLQKNINALQSVKSKPKTGHWVYKTTRGEYTIFEKRLMRIRNDYHFSTHRSSCNNNRTYDLFWNEVRRVVGVQKVSDKE